MIRTSKPTGLSWGGPWDKSQTIQLSLRSCRGSETKIASADNLKMLVARGRLLLIIYAPTHGEPNLDEPPGFILNFLGGACFEIELLSDIAASTLDPRA